MRRHGGEINGAYNIADMDMRQEVTADLRSGSSLLGADVEHVVASDEGVAVLVFELAVVVLLGLLEGDVHVAVQAGQHACVREVTVRYRCKQHICCSEH